MLLAIRNNAQSWVMWIIVILLIVPFALWGIHQYFGPEAEVAVAEVDGHELSAREFENTYRRQRQRLRLMMEDRGGLADIDDKRLREETLQGMINEEVVVQAGLSSGLRIGDEQLAAAIRQLDVFQEDGKFSQQRYEFWISNMGFVPGSFEHTLRRGMLRAQIHQGIAKSAVVTERALTEASRLADQRRTFGLTTISLDALRDPAAISAPEIEAYYHSHEAEFTTPEQVVVKYVELSKQKIAEGIQIDEAAARSHYENFKSSYVAPERRRASHILLTVPQGADGDEIERVRFAAEDIRRQLEAGADFAELARTRSEDPGSAANGGDLGFFERGATAPLLEEPLFPAAFEDAVFSMQVGEISDPVRSDDGFHIIRLDDVQAGGTKTFDDVRDQVIAEMRNVKAEERFYEQAEQFANLVYENTGGLEAVAESLGLEVHTSEPFSRAGGAGITADPRVVAAAFSDDVARGVNSEPIELEDLHLVALRLEERIPPTLQPLEEVSGEIRDRLAWQAARDLAANKGKELMGLLVAGGDGRQLARERGFSWKEIERASRRNDAVPQQVIDKVFRLTRPDGQPVVDGISVTDGDYYVIVLEAVNDGVKPPAQAADRRRQLLAELQGEEQFEALVRQLRNEADISIKRKTVSEVAE